MNDVQPPNRRLTIGEAARLAGVSTRAVRHYHAVGLLPEPERDASGYRRYTADDVVALVRIVRLRALGLPVPRIAAQLADSSGDGQNLQELARELADEIARLTVLHDRLVVLAAEPRPSVAETVTSALRDSGRLTPNLPLPPAEAAAAELADALHPAGAAAVMDAMAPMLADRDRADHLAELVRQVQQLPADADDDHLDRLVGELVALLPRVTPAPVPVDLTMLEKLLGHRLTAAQRRFHHKMRAALAATQ